MENIHAPAQDLSFEPNVSTRKVFVKRFDVDSVGMFRDGRWAEMIDWCQHNLYHGGYYEPNWYADYPTFYFYDEKEYTAFLLRWS
jgi:hypothetical protein